MIYKKKLKTMLASPIVPLLESGEYDDPRMELMKIMNAYEGAMKQMGTMLEILDAEFETLYDHNPIHHMESRIKSMPSILEKLERKNLTPTIENLVEQITDVVGLRIICHYIEDIYKLADLLCNQENITVIRKSDYIETPKPNGYRSLHLVLRVPVVLAHRTEHVAVEVQLRTIAMDMWASLEHELHYKSSHQGEVEHLSERLRRCAVSLADIDLRMQEIYDHIREG